MGSKRRSALLALTGILLLAINLRPVITAVGPIVGDISGDLSLTAGELGLLGALPLAMFGMTSGFVQLITKRFGVERATAGAMLVLTAATVVRSVPGPNANLWVGTVLIGLAIAVGNVAVPVLVKQSFPDSSGTVTGLYVAVLGLFAGLAAAFAVPIAEASFLGWRLSLAIWALLTVGAFGFWAFQSVRAIRAPTSQPDPLASVHINVWRSPTAWFLAAYMGLQSSIFYVSLTWLPTVEQSLGYSPAATGWHMFVLQVAGVAGNLVTPIFLRIGVDEKFAALTPGICYLFSVPGMYFSPQLALLWVAIIGFGTGVAFVVSLNFIVIRSHKVETAVRLSGMNQGVGYLAASIILFLAGTRAGENPLQVLLILFIASTGLVLVGFLAGRKTYVDDPATVST